MDPDLFLADLEAKPAALENLARALEAADPWAGLPVPDPRRVVLLGMGSSRYAAEVAALRLRSRGVDAVAEYASARLGHPPARDVLVVAISATGGSRETLDAVARHAGTSSLVALTNDLDSPLAACADLVVDLHAGPERGGVACRTFQHTGLLLRALEERLVGGTTPGAVATLARQVAAATGDLLERRSTWLPEVTALLDGPDGVYTIAPAERWSSAAQSALMVREGPRRPADACETGDWSHVDVYLTKTRDYRALLFPGSPYDEQAMAWIRERGSTVVSVGGDTSGARGIVRYAGDHDPDIALHTETLVAELVAATWWKEQS